MVRAFRAVRNSRTVASSTAWLGSATAIAFSLALLLGVAGLVWFGYRATREWQRSTTQLVDRRANEVLALLIAGLKRDMKGAQLSVLVPINHEALRPDPPHDLRQVFARAFARFPYPESFFVWRATDARGDGLTYFFNRADRPPRWQTGPVTADPYPVVLERDSPETRDFISLARRQAVSGRTFALVDTRIGGVAYQAVVHLLYRSSETTQLFALVGFTVDMDWVREHYFGPIVKQVARIGGEHDEMSLQIVNESGHVVTSNGVAGRSEVVVERPFPVVFFDPDLLAAMPPPRPQVPHWVARVAPGRQGAMDDVATGAGRTFLFISLAALTTVIGLVATARAARAAAALAAMQSDFVSTVTHELKTPLASIRLISETLARGRYSTASTIGDYARLLSDESERLRGLIDNLLTFARVNDARAAYSLEAVDLLDLVEDMLEHAGGRLTDGNFDVRVSIPSELPRIRVDRVAFIQVLANLIDNAIKYARSVRQLEIAARFEREMVVIELADRGMGIPRDEVDRVFDRFFRGQNAPAGGSGLGLTIARRVVEDHGGKIAIKSVPGESTLVRIELPVAPPT
jgi:signal transduction histidine kinase